MLRSRGNLSSYIFFLDLFIEIHQLSVLSLFSKSKQWLFAGFLQELTFPMLGFWAAGSPAQEPPVRHRLSLNSPSCSKTDFATPNLLVTTCSLKTVSFSLPWREQQFVPLSVYVPEMLHPCILCCLSGESWKASSLSLPWQVSCQNIWKTIMTTYNILIADQAGLPLIP